MKIKAVLFDLDGTLLPMDQEIFVKAYFSALAKKLYLHGYTDSAALTKAIWAGTAAMIKNDGSKTNGEVFWDVFAATFGEGSRRDEEYLDGFYKNEFSTVREVCGYTPEAKAVVELVKSLGARAVLATNPIFPRVATEQRISWAGLSPSDFELITSYENSRFSKPSKEYYLEIIAALGLSPSECLMVGNDVEDDMVVRELGLSVFLLTDNLINKYKKDVSEYPHGDFSELSAYLKSVLA